MIGVLQRRTKCKSEYVVCAILSTVSSSVQDKKEQFAEEFSIWRIRVVDSF